MRKGFIAMALTVVTGLVLSMLLTIIQDPFFVYRQPESNYYYNFINEKYQVPGIAKNFEYSNIISGSSMTENFNTKDFDEQFGGHTVKLSYSGETLKNKHDILELAFDSKQDTSINNVFASLDLWALTDDVEAIYNESPDYLMDHNIFNDVGYLLNKDVLFKNVVPNLLKNNEVEAQTMDSAFRWWGMPYGNYAIFSQWTVPSPWREEQDTSIYYDKAEANLNVNIIPLIEEHPETEFYFFYPPYSILYWYEKECSGEVGALLAMKDYVNERLMRYPNVKVYDFQWDPDIITNLWNYKDTTHYGQNIQDFIVNQFLETKYRVYDVQNTNNKILRETIDAFDIREYNSELLWEIEDIYNYMDYILEQDQYLVYFAVNGDSSYGWTDELGELWKRLGSNVNLVDCPNMSYLMILEKGNIIYENVSQDSIEYSSQDNGNVYMKSEAGTWDSSANIVIDGVEYSQNGRGMNIVVFDIDEKRVVDSICFDTSNKLDSTRLHGWR